MNSPAILQGSAEPVSPTRIAAASASPAHQFFNVVRGLISSNVYHTENQRLDALSAVSAYERQVVNPSDLRQVSSEDDAGPVEDVSQRVAPGIAQPSPVRTGAGAPIDYDQLAAALVRAGLAAQASSQPPVQAQ